jgi:2-(1,2-epoxy-1,2-dihydrophenyl)acetyl-CoA isomerase
MEQILAEAAGGIFRITLNRPDKLNPLSAQLMDELGQAMAQAGEDPAVRVVVLTGNGRAFSAGADLRGGISPGGDLGAALERSYNPLVGAMRAMPKPIIAAVNGIAAGAACNIALACDIVIAARSAVFIEVFARIGLLPDAGGTFVLPRAIGTPRALAASLLAEDITAERALEWGMVWQVVDDADLPAAADALARRLAAGPTRAYAAIKQALYASERNTLGEQLALEAELQRGLGHTADFAEGVAAFREKRPAGFTGQ